MPGDPNATGAESCHFPFPLGTPHPGLHEVYHCPLPLVTEVPSLCLEEAVGALCTQCLG